MSPTSEKMTVLVVTSGDGTGLNFVRSLKRAGGYRLVGLDTSIEDYVSSEADERFFVAAGPEDQFLDRVNTISARCGADLVYAADTNEWLELLSRRRESVNNPMFLPDHDDHVRAEDKWHTYQCLSDAGLPVPDSVLVRDGADLDRALRRHGAIWLRRTRGSGGAGSLATDAPALAHAWVESAGGWGQFMAAERLSVRTATFSGVWFDGELVASQLRERTAWKYAHLAVSGVTGITSGQRTLWDEELHDLAVRSVRQTMSRPHGAVGVDFTYGQDGTPYVTEVQPARFYSSMEFLAAVGINLPDLYCRLAAGAELPTGRPLINPIRSSFYWFKAVDKLPVLMTQQEWEAIDRLV
ncbi:hypothetical protein GCM10010310_63530 [Streptomyces violaceolatus]|uniref:ATP-grasp domain-containing protein n=2 Tax=Streptomyces violaceoruber group TaxID=2867121 RepID=A0ABN3TC47_9ACTN